MKEEGITEQEENHNFDSHEVTVLDSIPKEAKTADEEYPVQANLTDIVKLQEKNNTKDSEASREEKYQRGDYNEQQLCTTRSNPLG